MKLSNKILIGFFGFIFIYLSAAFAELRFTGTPSVIHSNNSLAETAALPKISYLVVTDLNQNVHVSSSDTARIEVRSFTGDILKNLTYNIFGDTLTLSNFSLDESRSIKITVFLPKSALKGLISKSSVVIVEGLDQDVLHISQNAGRIWMSDNSISKIKLEAFDQSYLDISTTELDTVSATIDASQVHFSTPVRVLEGSMKNSSVLRLVEANEIRFSKDKTSRMNLYQY
jgi:hypothetical protein